MLYITIPLIIYISFAFTGYKVFETWKSFLLYSSVDISIFLW